MESLLFLVGKVITTFGVIFVLLLLFTILYDKAIKKWFKIEGKKGLLSKYEYVNRFHKWVERLMLIPFIASVFIVDFIPYIELLHLILIFFIFLYGFRAYMQWKHEKASKEYILTISSLLWIILVAASINIFISV